MASSCIPLNKADNSHPQWLAEVDTGIHEDIKGRHNRMLAGKFDEVLVGF